MTPRATAGVVAAVSGALLVVGIVATSIAGSAGWAGAGAVTAAMGPSMMGGPLMPMAGGHMGAMGGMMRGIAGSTGDGPIAGAPEVRVQALNFRLEPSEVRLPKDRDVNLTLTNSTAVVHDITVPALGVQVVAQPGTTRTVGLRSLPAGRYVAYCSVPGHADLGMRATVVVE